MPGPVLTRLDIVAKRGSSYRPTASVADVSDEEHDELIGLCRERLADLKSQRGRAIWVQRRRSQGLNAGQSSIRCLEACWWPL